MLTWGEFKGKDLKRINEEYDIRVHYRGGDRYIAQFYNDGLAKNSEEAALPNTSDPERKKIIKERYAIVRKPIQEGKQERYYKEMALLYTLEKDS